MGRGTRGGGRGEGFRQGCAGRGVPSPPSPAQPTPPYAHGNGVISSVRVPKVLLYLTALKTAEIGSFRHSVAAWKKTARFVGGSLRGRLQWEAREARCRREVAPARVM